MLTSLSHWTLSKDEITLWTSLIPYSIASAGSVSVSANEVVETTVQRAFVDTKLVFFQTSFTLNVAHLVSRPAVHII